MTYSDTRLNANPDANPTDPTFSTSPSSFPHTPLSQTCIVDSSMNSAYQQKLIGMTVGIALTAIAIFATIFCLYHGFNMVDFATSSFMEFAGGALVYMGIVYSVVTIGNFLYTSYKTCCSEEEYKSEHIIIQAGLSIFAPIVAIPFALMTGAQIALSR